MKMLEFIPLFLATQSNGSTIKVAGQVYSVVHNGTAYGLFYYDDLAKFELPESTQIRDRMLKSIHFLNYRVVLVSQELPSVT